MHTASFSLSLSCPLSSLSHLSLSLSLPASLPMCQMNPHPPGERRRFYFRRAELLVLGWVPRGRSPWQPLAGDNHVFQRRVEEEEEEEEEERGERRRERTRNRGRGKEREGGCKGLQVTLRKKKKSQSRSNVSGRGHLPVVMILRSHRHVHDHHVHTCTDSVVCRVTYWHHWRWGENDRLWKDRGGETGTLNKIDRQKDR